MNTAIALRARRALACSLSVAALRSRCGRLRAHRVRRILRRPGGDGVRTVRYPATYGSITYIDFRGGATHRCW